MQSTSKDFAPYTEPLEDGLENSLIRVILGEEYKDRSFLSVCKELRDSKSGESIFGARGSELRRRVQRRRDYLLRCPGALKAALSPSPAKQKERSVTPKTTPTPTLKTTMSSLENKANNNFQLFFNDAERNPFGVVCLSVQDVPVNKKLVTKVRVIFANLDLTDLESGYISGRLSQDGDGIIVTSPVQPEYIGNRKNVDAITTGIDGAVVDKQTKSVYENATTAIFNPKTKTIKTREVFYAFPDGVTCNNKLFNTDDYGNPPPNEWELKMTIGMHVSKVKQGDLLGMNGITPVALKSYFVFEVALDQIDRPTEVHDASDKKDLSQAFSKLKLATEQNKGKYH